MTWITRADHSTLILSSVLASTFVYSHHAGSHFRLNRCSRWRRSIDGARLKSGVNDPHSVAIDELEDGSSRLPVASSVSIFYCIDCVKFEQRLWTLFRRERR